MSAAITTMAHMIHIFDLGTGFMLDAIPHTTLSLYPHLGPAMRAHPLVGELGSKPRPQR